MQTKADLFASDLAHLAEQAKALAHPARLAILQVLAARGTCICGDLVDELPLAQASVSRHLKALKTAGLIRGTIDGPRSCYCLDPEAVRALQAGMDTFFSALPVAPPDARCC